MSLNDLQVIIGFAMFGVSLLITIFIFRSENKNGD